MCTAAVKAAQEQQGYLTEQGVTLVLKPFNVDQLEEAIRAAAELSVTARKVQQGKDG